VVEAELSVRKKWRKMQNVEVSEEHSPNIPDNIADEAAGGLADFHETVYTRFKFEGTKPKLIIRHGSLSFFGTEVLAPGEVKTKFDPKPGC
jgi:hypothetical protein